MITTILTTFQVYTLVKVTGLNITTLILQTIK